MTFNCDLRHVSVKARNFKCFEEFQGFDTILPINLIVGRNNAGKSALLDIVVALCTKISDDRNHKRKNTKPEYRQGLRITKEMIEATFMDGRQLSGFGSNTRAHALQRCVGMEHVTLLSPGTQQQQQIWVDDGEVTDSSLLSLASAVRNHVGFPLTKRTPTRLRADRDIRTESSNSDVQTIREDGSGTTRLVELYLNLTDQHALVEKTIMRDLNLIIMPDWEFRRIFPKRLLSGEWELNLEDSQGTLVPLSHMGSGVKTILLVLVNLHLVPHSQGKQLSQYLFLFEELENNLHPAVQRRLFRFLRDKATKEGCCFFITTHSNAVIDLFDQDDEAQILHVTHDQDKAEVRTVSGYLHKCSILDDLDVRASDLLQANALVWVEGPSDRLYFNKWIELWTDREIREKVHYQCVWYGGALLADMTFDEPTGDGADPAADEELEALVSALKVNRHAVVLMDSDRRQASDPLKTRVERIARELRNNAGMSWVTAGREVENYIPVAALRDGVKEPFLAEPSRYTSVLEHIGWDTRRKMDLARRVVPHLTKAQLQATLDLGARLDEVCERIRQWNGLPVTAG